MKLKKINFLIQNQILFSERRKGVKERELENPLQMNLSMNQILRLKESNEKKGRKYSRESTSDSDSSVKKNNVKIKEESVLNNLLLTRILLEEKIFKSQKVMQGIPKMYKILARGKRK